MAGGVPTAVSPPGPRSYTWTTARFRRVYLIPEEARACWVPYYSISISDKNYTVYEGLSDEDKEIFVNGKEYDSQSEYPIWINLERQKVECLSGFQGAMGSDSGVHLLHREKHHPPPPPVL